jgi:hypothetical protein
MCEDVGLEEDLSRYFDEKGKYRPSDMTAKYNLFMPPQTLKLSVYRTSGMDEAEIWQIAADHIEPKRGKGVIGRANLKAAFVKLKQLEFDPNGVPHRKHADIIGWGDDVTQHRVIAMELAAEAQVILKS